MKKNRNNATRWDNTTGTRAFAPLGSDGTLMDNHHPLHNGNIAHTVQSLQPFGGWSGTGQSAQVLAQVYKYDQLNRLKRSQGVTGLDADNTWHEVDDLVADRYKSEYWYDANGNIDTLARFDGSGDLYDGMKFGYHVDANDRKVRNRPYHIRELAGQSGTVAADIPHRAYQPDDIVDRYNAGGTVNTANNYGYNELGQRIRDDQGEMEAIHWTASGKVKAIVRPGASSKLDIHFGYDAGGNRIMKRVGAPDLDAGGYSEHYVRDAQGNIMAIYRYTNTGTASFRVMERPIYGSRRLGSYDRPRQLLGTQNIPAVATMSHAAKRYELTDHLGNVATVVTGRLLPGDGAGSLYQAEVLSATLHEPFGLNLTGMNWQSDQARFGFQGQIKELEMNAIHFKYREYSLDGGGFWSVDPLAAKYPWNSPYAFSENRVIDSFELEGLESVTLNDGSAMPTGPANLGEQVDMFASSEQSKNGSYVTKWADGTVGLPPFEVVGSDPSTSNSMNLGQQNSNNDSGGSELLNVATPSVSFFGATMGAGSHVFYSEQLGTFLSSNNGKRYSIDKAANGTTGSKAAMKELSSTLSQGAKAFTVVSTALTIEQFNRGEINRVQFGAEMTSDGIGRIPLLGDAWTLGWEIGRVITLTPGYQEFKEDFQRNHPDWIYQGR